ncbi:MAG: bifunctional hydroxymethylpyrimidine kinase/phosphomethylpyrimidine kinase [Bacteroidia bacterium]|nr:bifunctional hydroxymethylpyrimidine kinase/phosphomethylpyrimidine kinase [Bacteroidia bacterium]
MQNAGFLHHETETLIKKFSQKKILVIGDLTLDEFITGTAERISREAPVPVIRYETTRRVPGGAANTVYNLHKLGAKVIPCGITGNDPEGKALLEIFEQEKIDTNLVFLVPGRRTITKTRISAHSRQSVTQQIVRIDKKPDSAIPEEVLSQICKQLPAALAECDAVICSDYGDGIFTKAIIELLLGHPLVIVDAQQHLARFRGATLFTPNVPEAALATGLAINNEESLIQAGLQLMNTLASEYLLITRGEEGMTLFERKPAHPEIHHIQPFNKTEVYDVTGAGDTVVAVLGLALSAGAPPLLAAQLSNIAAGLVVKKNGTATVTPEEILQAMYAV